MKTKKIRILIVDDDLFLQQMLSLQFHNEGIHQVINATTEKECLDNLNDCDVVLLDYYLNNENGIDILRKIKAQNPSIPVIFLSGQEYVNIAIRSLKYGAFDYLEKSKLNFNKIMDIINSAVDYQETMLKKSKLSRLKGYLNLGLLL